MKFQKAASNIFLDGEKIAFIRPDGNLQMLAGKTAHRDNVLTWLEETEPTTEDSSAVDDEQPSKSAIPPMPPQDPFSGDKTPEVVSWYQKYHPAEFASRYAGRNHPFSKK